MASLQSPESVKLIFGTAGLQRWNVNTVRQIFDVLEQNDVNDLDAAHIYVSLDQDLAQPQLTCYPREAKI